MDKTLVHAMLAASVRMAAVLWFLLAPFCLGAQTGPQGSVDLVSSATCEVAGWARDATTTSPIQVQVFADGTAGQGALIATITAGLLRSDLPFPDQYHGYDYTFIGVAAISDGKSHLLFVYAIGAPGDPNTLLNPTGSSITCGSLNTNVMSFGAAGDGVTDDAPAIQAAINATAPGGAILIPAGTYMLITPQGAPGEQYASAPCNAGQSLLIEDALILQKPNVTLTGVGRGTILMLGPNAKMQPIDLIGPNESVETLVVDGNGAARIRIDPSTGQPYSWPCGLVVAGLIDVDPLATPYRTSNNALIRDVELRNAIEDGAGGFLASGMQLDRIYAHDNGGSAFGYGPAAGGTGVEIAGGSGGSATNNVLLRNTNGIQVSFGVTGVTVANNVAMANCGDGLGLGSDFAYQGAAINSTITASSNWLESNGTVCNDAGLIIGDGVQNSVIFANAFVDNNFYGVQIVDEGAAYPVAQNLNFEQNLAANLTPARTQISGFDVTGIGTGINLSGNDIYDNGTSLNNQVTISGAAQVNANWAADNTLAYSPPGTNPMPQITSVANAAGGAAGYVAPGEIVTIGGSNLGPALFTSAALTPAGYYPRLVSGTRVLFDTVPGAILYASADKVAAVVPYFEYWRDTTQIQVEYQGSQSTAVAIPIAAAVPGLFSAASAPALGFGAVLNQDGSANSASDPASPGSVISVFATGEGQTNPAGVDTRVTTTERPVPRLPLTATVNGAPAQIQSANEAPGLVSGVLQVNIVVPPGTTGGVSVPIQISAGGQLSNVVDSAIQVFALSSSSANIASIGGIGSVNLQVAITGAATWTAQSNVSWITVTSNPSGTAGATIGYSVSPNSTSNSRTGTLTIAGQAFTVHQGTACSIAGVGTTGIADVQRIIGEAIGLLTPTDDLSGDHKVDVLDVEIVINAALNLGCTAD